MELPPNRPALAASVKTRAISGDSFLSSRKISDEFIAQAAQQGQVHEAALRPAHGNCRTCWLCFGRTPSQLAAKMGKEPDFRCYLLDISHPLLVEAYKHAAGELSGVAPVFPIHGNFHDLRSVIALAVQTEERRRLWCMIGNTFGNLDHEPRFLTDLAACAQRGDLLLLDLMLVWANPSDRTAILATDPVFLRKLPEPFIHWLTGPLHRYGRGARSINLEVELSLRCALPGSDQVTFWANVDHARGGTARHQISFVRRYTLSLLSTELRDMGWRTIRQFTYGPDEPQHRGGLLLERL